MLRQRSQICRHAHFTGSFLRFNRGRFFGKLHLTCPLHHTYGTRLGCENECEQDTVSLEECAPSA